MLGVVRCAAPAVSRDGVAPTRRAVLKAEQVSEQAWGLRGQLSRLQVVTAGVLGRASGRMSTALGLRSTIPVLPVAVQVGAGLSEGGGRCT